MTSCRCARRAMWFPKVSRTGPPSSGSTGSKPALMAARSLAVTHSSEAMNIISILLGVSLASGLSVYLTVFAMGLLQRFGVIHLPASLEVVSTWPVMIAAAGLYVIEFVVDKIPL